MDDSGTTAAIEHHLVDLARALGDSSAEMTVRALLDRALRRLQMHCSSLLYRSYPRLTRPPLNLQADELLGGVVERLLKSLANARPQSVRQFFALANQHTRWELNDLARRMDEKATHCELIENFAVAPESSGSGLSLNARRMLDAIESLPEDEKEVFSLVRIQGLPQSEVANLLGICTKTVQRRLNRGLIFLSQTLGDLQDQQDAVAAPPADSR